MLDAAYNINAALKQQRIFVDFQYRNATLGDCLFASMLSVGFLLNLHD